MKNLFARFIREEEGQDLIEYALLLGLIAIICITAITNVGTKISGTWTKINGAIS
jgi:pilus assembly protein Flp/PilA